MKRLRVTQLVELGVYRASYGQASAYSPDPLEAVADACGAAALHESVSRWLKERAKMEHSLKWDLRFLRLAMHVREWSKDPSTKHATVIVEPETRRVVSMGYNGFPRGCPVEMDEVSREEKYSRVIHGELNALLQAAEPVRGMTAYVVSGVGCDRCTQHLIQAGIKRFVFLNGDQDYWSRWGGVAEKSLGYLEEHRLPYCIVDVDEERVVREFRPQ